MAENPQEEEAREGGPEVQEAAPHEVAAPADPTNIEAAQAQIAQAALRASQFLALRQCLSALDPWTRSDSLSDAEVVARLREALDHLV
jgi:hypothetical protein